MSLKEKIHNDLIAAQKKAKLLEVSVLRMLTSSLHNKQIEKRARLVKEKQLDAMKLGDEQLDQLGELDEREIQEAIRSETKKRKEAIELYRQGNRQDLVDKEEAELAILERYLPQMMSEAEIEQLAHQVIAELHATAKQEFGRVMKEVMGRAEGRAEGDAVSKVVQRLLT